MLGATRTVKEARTAVRLTYAITPHRSGAASRLPREADLPPGAIVGVRAVAPQAYPSTPRTYATPPPPSSRLTCAGTPLASPAPAFPYPDHGLQRSSARTRRIAGTPAPISAEDSLLPAR
jgi:hypothetical protein